MHDEKDMIEINLNMPPTPPAGKESDFFGNIRFAKSSTRGFPYGDGSSVASELSTSCAKYSALGGRVSENVPENASNCCARHMHCPDCQRRLEAKSVGAVKLLSCCLPLFPLSRLKRHLGRTAMCSTCGNNLGYLKQI